MRHSLTVLAALALSACASPTAPPPPDASPTPASPPPSLVVIMTDDLDFPTTEELPEIGGLLADAGLSFTRAFVAQPLCAPSRATIFTGQYPHNHGVVDNAYPYGGHEFLRPHEGETIATWLDAAGYRTALMGKYMNDFPHGVGSDFVPPGWDHWYSYLDGISPGLYYDYFVNDNGEVSFHGTDPEDYSTDILTRRATDLIREWAPGPEPMFLYIATRTPHRPATYAARHGGEFRRAVAPRVPSFNEKDVGDKPYAMRQPPLTEKQISSLDKLQQWRLRSMRAVEELVAGVLQALAETGRLESTYVFFSSDNGLLMGQHRYDAQKRVCYEESIRVPLIVRGPGVRQGTTDGIVSFIDLAPTLLDLAGAPVPASVDGQSFVPLLRGAPPPSWRADILVESYGAGLSAALRTPEWAYIEDQTGEIELYDMQRDPYQLESLHRQADPELVRALHERLAFLLRCQGESCRG
jgi:N-acetylglucosamine-6-sulfatase